MSPTEAVRRIALRIAYDGGAYVGWQRQNPALKGRSVQETLEHALREVLGEEVRLNGAGRTDSGVHALGQCAHLDTKSRLPVDAIPPALAAILPEDITVWQARAVPGDFDARRSALSRSYFYAMSFADKREAPSCLARGRVGHFRGRHDLAGMIAASQLLTGGEKDFRHLRSSQCQAKSPVRTIDRLELETLVDDARRVLGVVPGHTAAILRIAARSFLMHQVRYIVGMLALVGRGRLYPAEVEAILRGEKPPVQITPAPPQGLTLEYADYGPGGPI